MEGRAGDTLPPPPLSAFPQATGFTHPDGDPVGVEVFQEGNSKFAGGLGQVLELGNGDLAVFLQKIHKLGLEGGQGLGVEIKVLFHLGQTPLVHQDLEQWLDLVERQFQGGLHLFQGGGRQLALTVEALQALGSLLLVARELLDRRDNAGLK